MGNLTRKASKKLSYRESVIADIEKMRAIAASTRGKKRIKQKEKVARDVDRCQRIAEMAGLHLADFIDNRKIEKGLGDHIPIEVKLAALKVINEKKRAGKKLTSDEEKVALTRTEQEILKEIKETKVESSYDKRTNVVTITVWALPPTVNSWNSFYTSEKQYAQALWDGLIKKGLDNLPVKLPYDVPVLVEGQAYKSRPTDEDNAASAKNPMDALKHCWLVWDDSPAYVKYYLNLKQIKCTKEEEHITFNIYPYPDDVEFHWEFRKLAPENVKKSRMPKAKKK